MPSRTGGSRPSSRQESSSAEWPSAGRARLPRDRGGVERETGEHRQRCAPCGRHERRLDDIVLLGDRRYPFTADLAENCIEMGVGGTLQMTPSASLYVNFDFATPFDADGYDIGSNIGLRMNW